MNTRVLPIINLVGCLSLSGLLIFQWRKEYITNAAADILRRELATTRQDIEEASRQRNALERDIVVLKESLEATQKSAEAAESSLEEKEQLCTELETGLAAARVQVAEWADAVEKRDERIRLLEADLTQARQRLDEAITRLKEASSR
jgi:chromosome segregation ATPase